MKRLLLKMFSRIIEAIVEELTIDVYVREGNASLKKLSIPYVPPYGATIEHNGRKYIIQDITISEYGHVAILDVDLLKKT